MAAKTVDQQKHEAERSPAWPEFRDKFIEANPRCAVCGKGTADGVGLQAHHIFPFHYCIGLGRPDLELDNRNLIALCENQAGRTPSDDHHLIVGHYEDFESSNLNVERDAKLWRSMSGTAIKVTSSWQSGHADRLPHLPGMTGSDKNFFVWAMNTRYPKAGVVAGAKPSGSAPAWLLQDMTPKPQ